MSRALVLCLVSASAVVGFAQQPSAVTSPLINTVDPPALVIGGRTTIQLVGKNLDGVTHLLLPFASPYS